MAQEFVTKAEFDAYVADARNTFEAIKAELAEQAHHSHDATTGEPKPPRELSEA